MLYSTTQKFCGFQDKSCTGGLTRGRNFTFSKNKTKPKKLS